MRKAVACLFLVMVLLLSSVGMVANAAQPDRTYIYEDNKPIPSTNAYQVELIVDETVMGTTRLKSPRDIFVDSKDYTYVLDSGNCRVLVLDKTYRCVKELTEFNYNGEVHTLAESAEGLFFRESNQCLYIADTENNRILVTDLDGNISKIYDKPVDELLDPTVPYKPKKIIVDNMGIMYVTSGNVNTGALLVDSDNNFLGFYGTNKLTMTAAMKLEYWWRSILSDEANAQSAISFQPVEFNNLFWSDDRFVYTVSPLVSNVESAVSKLNALGNNVFPESVNMYELAKERGIITKNVTDNGMVLADITVDSEGIFTIVDMITGHLFQYDEGCNLLAIFGGMGYQQGLFLQPLAIESNNDNNLLVLDAGKNTITVMEQTFYGKMIREANYLYNQGLYQDSVEPWMEVLRMNANYTQAYAGLGKAYYSMTDYEKAMEYFKLGNDKEGYAEAKVALRDQKVRDNFALVAVIVVIILIVILGYDQIKDLISRLYWRIRK